MSPVIYILTITLWLVSSRGGDDQTVEQIKQAKDIEYTSFKNEDFDKQVLFFYLYNLTIRGYICTLPV